MNDIKAVQNLFLSKVLLIIKTQILNIISILIPTDQFDFKIYR